MRDPPHHHAPAPAHARRTPPTDGHRRMREGGAPELGPLGHTHTYDTQGRSSPRAEEHGGPCPRA
eukprot:4172763-Prymnesium_polylepis.1